MDTNNYSYRDSPEAKIVFAPANDETVQACLVWGIDKLSESVFNGNILLSLISHVKDIIFLTITQRQVLRKRCIYLRKAYENFLQCINVCTWIQCIHMAIDELPDRVIVYNQNDKSIWMMQTQFKTCEHVIVPILQPDNEPDFFFFSEGRTQFIRYCNA